MIREVPVVKEYAEVKNLPEVALEGNTAKLSLNIKAKVKVTSTMVSSGDITMTVIDAPPGLSIHKQMGNYYLIWKPKEEGSFTFIISMSDGNIEETTNVTLEVY